MKIRITTAGGRSFDIDGVRAFFRISQLKDMIKKKTKIPVNRQELVSSGVSLADYCTVADFGINKDSIVHLYRSNKPLNTSDPNTKILLTLKLPSRSIATKVPMTTTIFDLKKKIQAKEKITLDRLAMYFRKSEVKDPRTLLSYNIGNKSILEVREVEKKIFLQVKIPKEKNRKFNVYVSPSNTILEVKREIQEKEKYSVNRLGDDLQLVYRMTILDNTKKLADYGFFKTSNVILMLSGTVKRDGGSNKLQPKNSEEVKTVTRSPLIVKKVDFFSEHQKKENDHWELEKNILRIPLIELSPRIDQKTKKTKLLGSGVYGKSYLYKWTRSGEEIPVVVKIMKSTVSKEIIDRQIRVIQYLHHPGVVKVYGYVLFKRSRIGVVSEYVKGGNTIYDLIEKKNKHHIETSSISNFEKWFLIKKMIQSVHFLHSRDIIHRAIKPSNFLVSRDRKQIKICDFGISQLVHPDLIINKKKEEEEGEEDIVLDDISGFESPHHKVPVMIQSGTSRYFSPQLFGQKPEYSKSSDIFALGMTIFAVVEGDLAFKDVKDDMLLMFMIWKGEIPQFTSKKPRPIVEEELEGEDEDSDDGVAMEFKELIFEKCLKYNTRDRATCNDLLQYMSLKEEEFVKKFPPPAPASPIGRGKGEQAQKQQQEEEPQKRAVKSIGVQQIDGDHEKIRRYMLNLHSVFSCPITFELMENPVMIVETQMTYEKEAIEEWLESHNTDPMTGLELKSKTLIPNLYLRKAINEWKELQPKIEKKY